MTDLREDVREKGIKGNMQMFDLSMFLSGGATC